MVRPVTVGVDGSPQSLTALDLAWGEAARRGAPLRIIHADSWAAHPALVDTDPTGAVARDLARRPEQVLHDAMARVAGRGVSVDGRVVAGGAGRVLLRESADAALLVVGHRDRGGPVPGLLLGSVALRLAGHATCPVLIARGRPDPGGDVVVAVPSRPAEDAIGFAFEEASLRDTDLLAVHAWHGCADPLDDLLPPVYQPNQRLDNAATVLADALEAWRAKYPQVVVRRRLVRGYADRVLVDASRFAQLVVVGPDRPGIPDPRGRERRSARVDASRESFRSVRHALLHAAACPIAVVQ